MIALLATSMVVHAVSASDSLSEAKRRLQEFSDAEVLEMIMGTDCINPDPEMWAWEDEDDLAGFI